MVKAAALNGILIGTWSRCSSRETAFTTGQLAFTNLAHHDRVRLADSSAELVARHRRRRDPGGLDSSGSIQLATISLAGTMAEVAGLIKGPYLCGVSMIVSGGRFDG